MVNFFSIYMPLLRASLKLFGLRPHSVEIEPGTIINVWCPAQTKSNQTKQKKAVVFLHGFAADGIFTWQFQALALAREYAVYVPDFLFFGGSVTGRADRSPEFQAECMAKALRRLGVERCTLVGLSYGGMVGFKMAELYPELIESVVASSTVMALTESVSSESLRRLGFEKWSDVLLPETVEGVVKMFDVGSYKVPNAPKWIFKHFLEVNFITHFLFHAIFFLYIPLVYTKFTFNFHIHIIIYDNDVVSRVNCYC